MRRHWEIVAYSPHLPRRACRASWICIVLGIHWRGSCEPPFRERDTDIAFLPRRGPNVARIIRNCGGNVGAPASARPLLIIDEVSLIGRHLLGMVSDRMEAARARLRIREGTSDQPGGRNSAASSLIGGIGFGGCAVLLSGDFAQIPPVLATSLLDTRTADASTCPNARWQNAGPRAFVA